MRRWAIIIGSAGLAFAPSATAGEARAEKHITLLATGGTIAGAGNPQEASYRAGVVPIDAILRAVPTLADIAQINAEQVANIGSYDMNETVWLKLLERVRAAALDPDTSGIIVTHGTDTLEETAFFLALTAPAAKPVVLVGAMRPGTAVSPDGPANLLDAARVAVSPEATGQGTVMVMNDTIFDPVWVMKSDVRRVNAFTAPARGAIGDVLREQPRFFAPARTRAAPFDIDTVPLPRIAVAYAYAGVSGDDIRAAASGAKGLIVAGVGAGSFSADARRAVRELTASGIAVVRTARQGYGDVWINPPSMGELSDSALGTVAGRELTPAKARILLMLALQKARSTGELQTLFDRFGGDGGGG